MLETQKIDISDVLIWTDLTIADQENLNGGQGAAKIFVLPGSGGGIQSQYGDTATTPDGTVIRDNNPCDDPYGRPSWCR